MEHEGTCGNVWPRAGTCGNLWERAGTCGNVLGTCSLHVEPLKERGTHDKVQAVKVRRTEDGSPAG